MKTIKLIRLIAQISLLLISVITFNFALISGANIEQDGVSGIIHNFPNTWPWLLLLALTILSWKKPLLSGALITITGIVFVYFFNIGEQIYSIVLALSTSVALLGLILLYCQYYLKRLSE